MTTLPLVPAESALPGDPSAAVALGPILLATDGTDSASGALRIARRLADRSGRDVHVLAVLEPVPPVVPVSAPLVPPQGWDTTRSEQLLELQVRRQLRRHAGEGEGWTVEIRVGSPASVIAAVAAERGAALIVTGLSHRGLLDRLLGGDTPRHVAQLAEVPVLAVAEGTTELPRRLLVAVDFSQASVFAARVALELFPFAESMYLAHVRQRRELDAFEPPTWKYEYEQAIPRAFDRLKAQLRTSVRLDTVTLAGSPAREILDFAEYARADLLVVGSHRRSMLRRLVLGSVAARLLRGASTSVLLVPAPVAAQLAEEAADGELQTETLRMPELWTRSLREFTKRNAGRRVTLEIHDRELGAQAQASDYRLAGVDFDPHDEDVEIMLGGEGGGAWHLTHRVRHPLSIDVLRGRDGVDRAMRIAHAGGQALVVLA